MSFKSKQKFYAYQSGDNISDNELKVNDYIKSVEKSFIGVSSLKFNPDSYSLHESSQKKKKTTNTFKNINENEEIVLTKKITNIFNDGVKSETSSNIGIDESKSSFQKSILQYNNNESVIVFKPLKQVKSKKLNLQERRESTSEKELQQSEISRDKNVLNSFKVTPLFHNLHSSNMSNINLELNNNQLLNHSQEAEIDLKEFSTNKTSKLNNFDLLKILNEVSVYSYINK